MKKLMCAFMLLWGSVYCADERRMSGAQGNEYCVESRDLSGRIGDLDMFATCALAARILGKDNFVSTPQGEKYSRAELREGVHLKKDGSISCNPLAVGTLFERASIAWGFLETLQGQEGLKYLRQKNTKKEKPKYTWLLSGFDRLKKEAERCTCGLSHCEYGEYYSDEYSYYDYSSDDDDTGNKGEVVCTDRPACIVDPYRQEVLEDAEVVNVELKPTLVKRRTISKEEFQEARVRAREKARMQRQRMAGYHSMYDIGVSLRTAERLIEEEVRRAEEDAEYILLDERLQDCINRGNIADSCQCLVEYVDRGARGGGLAHLIPLLLNKVLDGRIDDPHLFGPLASLPLWRDLRRKGVAKSMLDDARNAWKALEPFQRFARFLRDDLGVRESFDDSLPKLNNTQRQVLQEQIAIIFDNAAKLRASLSEDSDLLLFVFAQLFGIGKFCDSVGMLGEAEKLFLVLVEQGSMFAHSRLACVYLKQGRVPESKELFKEFLAACDPDNPTHMARVSSVSNELYLLYCEEKGSFDFALSQESDVDEFLAWSACAGHPDACALNDYLRVKNSFHLQESRQDAVDVFKDIVARQDGEGFMKGPAAVHVCVDALERDDLAMAIEYMQYVEDHHARPYKVCLVIDQERAKSIITKLDDDSLTDDECYMIARGCIDSPVLDHKQLMLAVATLVRLANNEYAYAVAWKEQADPRILFQAACAMRDLSAIMAGINDKDNIPNGLLMNTLSLLLNDLLNEKKAGDQLADIQYQAFVKAVDTQRGIVIKSFDPAMVNAVQNVCVPGTADDKFSMAIQGLIDGGSTTTS